MPPLMCVWLPPMQQRLEETQRRRRLIANFTTEMKSLNCVTRAFTIDFLIWTANGRPHPAVTQTLQYAAHIASMLAKSLQRRWKHEIQIALLRRRAAMTRAVLPNPSARADWLLAGVIDRSLQHWGNVTPLDGGLCDHDHADSETDTAIPDDDDDIASLASLIVRIFAAIEPLSVWFCLHGAVCLRLTIIFPGDFVSHFGPRGSPSPGDLELGNIFEDHGVSRQITVEMLALELETHRRCCPAQLVLSALQRFNRRMWAHLVRHLAATANLPPHSALFFPAAGGPDSQMVDRKRGPRH